MEYSQNLILLLAAAAIVAALALVMTFRGQLGDEVGPIVLDRTSSPSATASASPSTASATPTAAESSEATTEPEQTRSRRSGCCPGSC
ncbi:hypothetical protein E4U03_02475 [Rothia nasimurium]|uniref:Uncharacterized protein n=1 Tax=Rothia nasimurium TaxID=85336 RepID=A0A4Y9F5D6_9MICC|nr:hypothetical protein [Rothia nasimurium]MBF0807481.1 hypothetical protein [Rothia nasimurium]TFU23592.1 hypothetical protein E4U03_02475 [Rothia nasimurium]